MAKTLPKERVKKVFDLALKRHRGGDLARAYEGYKKVLFSEPDHAGARHLVGLLAYQTSKFDEALQWIDDALTINPDFAEAHYNKGKTLAAMRRQDEAIACFEKAVELKPDYADALLDLGNAAADRGDHEAAIARYDDALAHAPKDGRVLSNRAAAFAHLNRHEDAREDVAAVLDLSGDFPDVLLPLGRAMRKAGYLVTAEEVLRQALKVCPGDPEIANVLGLTLKDRENYEEARTLFEGCVDAEPENLLFLVNLAETYKELDQPQKAIDTAERAIELQPGAWQPFTILGNILSRETKFDDAFLAYRKSLDLAPTVAETWINLASCHQHVSDHETALPLIQKGLSLNPTLAMGYWNLSHALLATGRIAEGWDVYGFGFAAKQRKPLRPFPDRLWDGGSLRGETLMVWREQGIGDDLRFSTCYDELIEQADHVIIETSEKLVTLYQRTWPQATVRAERGASTGLGNMSEEDVDFDVTAPAGLAASYLRRSLGDFPKTAPMLKPDPDRVADLRARVRSFGAGPVVGLSWRSRLTNAYRQTYYTALSDWADLLSTPGAVFVNLQYDYDEEEIASVESEYGVRLHRFEDVDLLDDLDDAAALTSVTDLVISAGTSVAEMACRVGVETYCYTKARHPMALGCDHIPWFPAMRFYPFAWPDDARSRVPDITRDARSRIGELAAQG